MRSTNVKATIAGAMVGGIIGYLFFTDEGRALRRQVERSLEDLGRELNSARNTVERAANVASEGWQLLNDVVGDSARQPMRHTGPRQTAPF